MKLLPASTKRSSMRWASAGGVLPPMSMVPRQRRLTCSGPSSTWSGWFIGVPSGSGGTALDQRQGVHDFDGFAVAVADLGHQEVDRVLADFGERLAHGRESENLREVDVVEADHGEVAGDVEPGGGRRLEHADGLEVGG